MNRFLERSFPPGFSYRSEIKPCIIALVAGILINLIRFLTEYSSVRWSLYIRIGTDAILDESRVMPDFAYVLGDRLNILLILAALSLIIASAIHYAYYRTAGKSIYLMRRLPNRFELHRRCLLMPAIYALAFLLAAAALLLIYYAVYMNKTPQACLTPNQWQKLWAHFLRRGF